MEVMDLVSNSSGDRIISSRIKIPKKKLPDDLSKGDNIDVEHEAVKAYIMNIDEFDIPPTWVVMVNVNLVELAK